MKKTIPTPRKITLYETLRLKDFDGFDIADDIFDWGNYFECGESLEKSEDYYDKLMVLFALNIEVVKYQENWYTICKVAEFISKHSKAFTKFMNENNREDYQPKNYKGEKITLDNDLFYDLYIMTFESLINGNYCESQYKELYELLTK